MQRTYTTLALPVRILSGKPLSISLSVSYKTKHEFITHCPKEMKMLRSPKPICECS